MDLIIMSEITKLNITTPNKGSIVQPVHQSHSVKKYPKESITNINIKQEGLSVEGQPATFQHVGNQSHLKFIVASLHPDLYRDLLIYIIVNRLGKFLYPERT